MGTSSEEKRASRDEHVDQVRDNEHYDEKTLPQSNTQEDYTGVSKKTDPEEIKLVRKLDFRIMVSLCTGIIGC